MRREPGRRRPGRSSCIEAVQKRPYSLRSPSSGAFARQTHCLIFDWHYFSDASGDYHARFDMAALRAMLEVNGVLAAADWASLTMLHDGTESDHLYLFRIIRNGQPVHIAWWDTFDETGYLPGDRRGLAVTGLTGSPARVTSAVPTASTGADVMDCATAFAVASSPP